MKTSLRIYHPIFVKSKRKIVAELLLMRSRFPSRMCCLFSVFVHSRVDLLPRDQRRLPGVPAGAGGGCGGGCGGCCGGFVVYSPMKTDEEGQSSVLLESQSWVPMSKIEC